MIRAESLYKSYRGVPALQGVSFAIAAGEVVGFLGPNGAGKSTTLRLLCGLLAPDAGSLEVAGRRLPEGARAARAALGYLPESTPLYRGMRLDRFLRFCGELKGLSGAALSRAIERVAGQCGLEARLTQRIEELSKGFRQRAGLAQALIADPAVLILDEPTSGLDPLEVARLRELIRELGRTKTVLLSTHVLGEVEELCGRGLMLYGGRLLADGPLASLTHSPRLLLALEPRSGAARERDTEAWLRCLPGAGLVEPGPPLSGAPRFAVSPTDRAAFQAALLAAVARGEYALEELAPERRSLETVFREQAARAAEARP
jgi:ABC-2 type transport system ATP-binding protein